MCEDMRDGERKRRNKIVREQGWVVGETAIDEYSKSLTFPNIRTKSATAFTTDIRRMFLRIRKNALREDLQKENPYMEVCMYAFLLRNFAHFSRHHMQHCSTHMRYSMTLFLLALACFCMYASTDRMVLMTAIMREPNAAVPRWYMHVVRIACRG
jgi:hypothetical protein